MNVFIVDDSAIFRTMILNSLAELDGIQSVGEAETAIAALEAINKLRPDVVILDIRLRAGTGIDVLREIKKSGEGSPTTIVMTNYPYEQYRRTSLSMGAEYFFHKATQFNDALTVLKVLAATKQQIA